MQKQPEGLAFLFCIFGLMVHREAVIQFYYKVKCKNNLKDWLILVNSDEIVTQISHTYSLTIRIIVSSLNRSTLNCFAVFILKK